MRRTKILATIGPSSRSPVVLQSLIEAGMDCARLNMSHGSNEEHAEVICNLREIASRLGRRVAVLQDLAGTKLRLGELADPVRLEESQEFWLVGKEKGEGGELPFPYPAILAQFQIGNSVYIADGTLLLEVIAKEGARGVLLRVRTGGVVSSFKGVNLPGASFPRPVLTDKDLADLEFGARQGVEWVAASFVRNSKDVEAVRTKLRELGSQARVMAKLERPEALDNLSSILEAVDAVMIARGDLGIEMPMEQVPRVQERVVLEANKAGKICVVATQMLASMTTSSRPSRAEVADVHRAVEQGADGILLSDEVAVGQHPVAAVRWGVTIVEEAESSCGGPRQLFCKDLTQSMAQAASTLADERGAKILVVTSTGRAAVEVARFRPQSPILVFSHEESILHTLLLGWGLRPVAIIPKEPDIAKLIAILVEEGIKRGAITTEDTVVIVHGFLTGVSGTTNTVQALHVAEYLKTRNHALS